MRRRRVNGAFVTLVAAILVGTAVVSGWIVVDAGVLATESPSLGAPVPAPVSVQTESLQAENAAKVTGAGSFQISQPRDPFRPLITEDSPLGFFPGVGGPPGAGSDNGFTGGTTITLQDVRDVGGVLRATVVVNGTPYEVGIGDTFATSYKVVSLTEDKGVFMFGDNAFELGVGQQILK